MPFRLRLVKSLMQAGWKVKIHDAERLEPPHITIYRKMDRWRVCLRDGEFLDRDSRWSQIDRGVRKAIEENWETLIVNWNDIHPENPV